MLETHWLDHDQWLEVTCQVHCMAIWGKGEIEWRLIIAEFGVELCGTIFAELSRLQISPDWWPILWNSY